MSKDESGLGNGARSVGTPYTAGAPTPSGTRSAPIFAENVADLIRRLTHDDSPAAQEMLREAVELGDCFRKWQIQRPTQDVRVATIQQLFDLNRRAMDHLSRGHAPQGGATRTPSSPPSSGLLRRLFKRSTPPSV